MNFLIGKYSLIPMFKHVGTEYSHQDPVFNNLSQQNNCVKDNYR